jgi:SAM-dependent methyltransferase
MDKQSNLHAATVTSFGEEWAGFDQSGMTNEESRKIFEQYFAIFPWDRLPENPEGFDMGCGSGRWAIWVSQKVSTLHCIDPSSAIDIARKKLSGIENIVFHHAGVGNETLPTASQDFGYALGVLHHVPDTEKAILQCTDLLKPGAPFLVYLYYAFDNRSLAFRLTWKASDWLRKGICLLPEKLKVIVTDTIAMLVYLPMALLSIVLEKMKFDVSGIPLSFYRHHSFYTMRTDSRDRFGTPLEQRFSRLEILKMMERSGLTDVQFLEGAPFWCACGIKRTSKQQSQSI